MALLWLAAATSGCESDTESLADIHGKQLETDGRVLLVNYWAEWCAPCREEIPELNRFARESEGVLVLGVNYDQPPAEVTREQIKKLGIEFPVLSADPAARWGQARPTVLPSTFVIGIDGRWRATLVGPQTEESLHAAVASLSAEGG